jgi:hypothetical protein
MNASYRLFYKLNQAAIPVYGVADNEDGTYRIDYAPEATPAHKTAAVAIVATFDPDEPVTPAELSEQDIQPIKALVTASNAEISLWLDTHTTKEALIVVFRILRFMLRQMRG